MHRLLEKLDGAGTTVVVLLYLGGLGLGTVSYFAGIVTDLGLGAGMGLALAVEIHSWLQQRRTYESFANWTQARRAGADEDALADRRKTFWTNLLVFGLLLSFSMFCSIMFTASYWKPTTAWPPYVVQIILRGSIIPVLFALTAMLAPLHTDASALLAKTSHDMLDRTLRQMRKQWYGRISTASKNKLDLAPIGIALMEDAGDRDGARRIQLIAAGLDRAEGRDPSRAALPAPGAERYDSDWGSSGVGRALGQSSGSPASQWQTTRATGTGNGNGNGNGARHEAREARVAETRAAAEGAVITGRFPFPASAGAPQGVSPRSAGALALIHSPEMPDVDQDDEATPNHSGARIAKKAAQRKQRKADRAARAAKSSPEGQVARSPRWDAGISEEERMGRIEDKITVGKTLLAQRFTDSDGVPRFWNKAEWSLRDLAETIGREIRREPYLDDSGCTIRIAQRAGAEWDAEVQRHMDRQFDAMRRGDYPSGLPALDVRDAEADDLEDDIPEEMSLEALADDRGTIVLPQERLRAAAWAARQEMGDLADDDE